MAGSTVHTDESAIYRRVGGLLYKHETINHGVGEYRRGDVTTNGIESVFAVLKRGLHGVYHHASPKHLSRYVNEFAFRLNDGDAALCSKRTKAVSNVITGDGDCQRFTCAAPLEEWAL